MDYNYRCFDNYAALSNFNESLAQELLKDVGKGEWQNDEIYYYPSLEDFAKYEVIEGWYSTLDLNHDYHGAPDLLNYIDYEGLAEALINAWDIDFYWTNDTVVLSTNCGGWR